MTGGTDEQERTYEGVFELLDGDLEHDVKLLKTALFNRKTGVPDQRKIDDFVNSLLVASALGGDVDSETNYLHLAAAFQTRQYDFGTIASPPSEDGDGATDTNNESLPVRGALGFLLFAKEINQFSAEETDLPPDHPIRDLFADRDVRLWLRMWYRMDQDDYTRYAIVSDDTESVAPAAEGYPKIHKIGTTSFVFLCADSEATSTAPVAIKCLIPRYTRVPNIARGLGAQISEYWEILDDRNAAESVDPEGVLSEDDLMRRVVTLEMARPKSDAILERFLVMDYIKGPTLDEQLDKFRGEAVSEDEFNQKGLLNEARMRARHSKEMIRRLNFVEGLTQTLCPALGTLNAIGHPHLDLSPFNVILRGDDHATRVSDPVLIDFGKNNLLVDGVAAFEPWDRARTFIAPEVRTGKDSASDRADIFSLGVILLEAMSDEKVSRENMKGLLEVLWEREPALAQIIEDMIDEDPANRLTMMPADFPGTPFQYINELIDLSVDERREFHERRNATEGFEFWRQLLRPDRPSLTDLFRELSRLRELADAGGGDSEVNGSSEPISQRESKLTQSSRDLIRTTRFDLAYLATVGIVIGLVWYFLLYLALGISLAEWHWTAGFSALPSFLESAFRRWGVIGSFKAHAPGRVVALSTAFIGVAYYRHIFVGITARHLRTAAGRAAELSMRTAILFALALQIWAFLFPGKWEWAVLGGSGGVFVALNNRFCRSLTRDAQTVAKRYHTIGDRFAFFISEFDEWPRLMFLYSAGGATIGLLLYEGWAHDRWVFALIMTGANLVKLYGSNTRHRSPTIRANLARVLFLLERRPSAETAHKSPEPATTEIAAAIAG